MANDQAYLGINKLKSARDMDGCYEHNMRLCQVLNADPALLPANRELISSHGVRFYDSCRETIAEMRSCGAMKYNPRSTAVLGYEIVVDCPEDAFLRGIDIDEWSDRTINWIDREFNPPGHEIAFDDYRSGERKHMEVQNIKHAVLHMDETFPHIHALIVPIDPRGHLCARHYTGMPHQLEALQDRYIEAVKDMGIRRGCRNSVVPRHQQNKYRSGMREAVLASLPPIEPGDSLESYKEKADHAYMVSNVHHNHEIVGMRKEINALRAENVTLKKETGRLLLEAGLDMEHVDGERMHEIGVLYRKGKAVEEALDEYPDREVADTVRQDLDAILRWARERLGRKTRTVNERAV